jgi:hypothetical protein
VDHISDSEGGFSADMPDISDGKEAVVYQVPTMRVTFLAGIQLERITGSHDCLYVDSSLVVKPEFLGNRK